MCLGAFTGVFAAPPSTAQAVLRDRHQYLCVSHSRWAATQEDSLQLANPQQVIGQVIK